MSLTVANPTLLLRWQRYSHSSALNTYQSADGAVHSFDQKLAPLLHWLKAKVSLLSRLPREKRTCLVLLTLNRPPRGPCVTVPQLPPAPAPILPAPSPPVAFMLPPSISMLPHEPFEPLPIPAAPLPPQAFIIPP